MGPARTVLAQVRAAVAFATIVPVRGAPPPAGLAVALFPLVGAAVGAVAGGVRWVAEGALGSGGAALSAALVVVVLTGALHLDGLADCADAVGARGRDRRLAVLRDPRLGTFGAVAVFAWLGGVQTALARLDSAEALAVLVAVTACARFAAVAQAAVAPAARPEGLGASFAPGAGVVMACGCAALLAALAPALVAPWGWALGVGFVVAAALFGSASATVAVRAIGGRTGDTLGAVIALFEVLALLIAAAVL